MFSFSRPGSLPAVQVLPQPVLPGGGAVPVCPSAGYRLPVHILGTSGMHGHVSEVMWLRRPADHNIFNSNRSF